MYQTSVEMLVFYFFIKNTKSVMCLFRSNYEKIFVLEFSMEYFSIRILTEDFLDILEII